MVRMVTRARPFQLAVVAIVLLPALLPAVPAIVELRDAKLPVEQTGSAAVWTGEDAYVFGGCCPDGRDDIVTRYDPESDQVEDVADLPVDLSNMGAVWSGSFAYLFGGQTDSGMTDRVIRFDPATGSTLTVAHLPTEMEGIAAVWDPDSCADGCAYLFGGEAVVSSGEPAKAVDWILRYDPNSQDVRSIDAELPKPVHDAAAAFDGDRAYVFGGDSPVCSGGVCDDIVRFDPDQPKATVADATLPKSRSAMSAAWTGNYVYLFGGWKASQTDAIERYNPRTDILQTHDERLPSPRAQTSAVFTGEDMYVFAGHDDSDARDIVRFSVCSEAARTSDDDRDGLTACQESQQGTSDRDEDTDDDGIDDRTESGYYADREAVFCDGGGTCRYPDPTTRDLYVEIDWMMAHRLDPDERRTIVENFDQAPINNGIGDPVRLHLDAGLLGGGGDVVAFDEYLDKDEYEGIRDRNFASERDGIFRYGLIACKDERTRHGGSIWGWGEVPGDEFAVFDCEDRMDEDGAQAKEIMHELGHTILGWRITDPQACQGETDRSGTPVNARRNPDLAHFDQPTAHCDRTDAEPEIYAHPRTDDDVMSQGGPRGKTTTTYAVETWYALKLDFGIDGTVDDCRSRVILPLLGSLGGQLFPRCRV